MRFQGLLWWKMWTVEFREPSPELTVMRGGKMATFRNRPVANEEEIAEAMTEETCWVFHARRETVVRRGNTPELKGQTTITVEFKWNGSSAGAARGGSEQML
jgi:hypothetical protein